MYNQDEYAQKDNTCNYSKEWQPYIGDYDKFEYDVKTKEGDVWVNCYPNAGYFNPINVAIKIPQEDVAEIRFSEKPKIGINYDSFYKTV